MTIKNDTDLAYKLVEVLDLILEITQEVYAIAETIAGKSDNFNQDMFTLCTLAIDNGIRDIVLGLLMLTETTKESKLTLGSDGSVAIEAQTLIQAVTTTSTEVETPTLALQQFSLVVKVAGLLPDLGSLGRDIAALALKGVDDSTEKLMTWEEL